MGFGTEPVVLHPDRLLVRHQEMLHGATSSIESRRELRFAGKRALLHRFGSTVYGFPWSWRSSHRGGTFPQSASVGVSSMAVTD